MDYNNTSVKKNFIYNSVFQILLLLFPLVSAPYVSRVLGSAGVGRYSFSNSIVVYFVILCNFGSSLFGQKNIAFYRDNKEKTTEIFWDVVSFRFVSCVLFLSLFFLCLFVSDSINSLFCILALNIVNVFTDITWFYHGLEDFRKTIIYGLINKTVYTILVFCLIKTADDLPLYALLSCGFLILGNLALWFPMKKHVSRPSGVRPFGHIKEMFFLFLPTIATQVYMVFDKTMIGWITRSDYANGCYEQSEKIARISLTLVISVGSVILSRVANLFQKKNMDLLKSYIYKALRAVWAISIPLMFGTVAISSFLIPIYLGDDYALSVVLLQIFSLLILFVSLANIIGLSYLIPTNQQNVYTISVSVSAVLNLLMNLFLIPWCGAIGAAIASVFAEFVGVFIQIVFCVRSNQLSLKGIFSSSKKYWVASVIMFVLVIGIKWTMEKTTVFNLLLLIVVGVVSYFVILVVLKDSLLLEIIETGLHRFRKKEE